MFRYYSLARRCFAYRVDVSYYGHPAPLPEDEFKKSKRHTRGWTLQELIAPKDVAFVSKSWHLLGVKRKRWNWRMANLCMLVEEATGVPVDVLQDPMPKAIVETCTESTIAQS
ncbi:hypothetical protein C8Q74DRAFT_1305858, partial [Fomes fomentarius]